MLHLMESLTAAAVEQLAEVKASAVAGLAHPVQRPPHTLLCCSSPSAEQISPTVRSRQAGLRTVDRVHCAQYVWRAGAAWGRGKRQSAHILAVAARCASWPCTWRKSRSGWRTGSSSEKSQLCWHVCKLLQQSCHSMHQDACTCWQTWCASQPGSCSTEPRLASSSAPAGCG